MYTIAFRGLHLRPELRFKSDDRRAAVLRAEELAQLFDVPVHVHDCHKRSIHRANNVIYRYASCPQPKDRAAEACK